MFSTFLKKAFLLLAICTGLINPAHGQGSLEFDLVLKGGRVIDPETNLDAIRNIGIIGNRIVEISSETLTGKEIIDVSGLVVSPGFIDLHVHGVSNKEQEYQMHDGVTTALDLEIGVHFLDKWYNSRESKALINYGTSVNWAFERYKSIETNEKILKELEATKYSEQDVSEGLYSNLGPSYKMVLTDEQLNQTLQNIENELSHGGLGIAVPVGYLTGATPKEIYRIYEFAKEKGALIYSHVREGGIIAVQQAISDAVVTGASLHIVHINSMALADIEIAIEMIQTSQKKGYDISTELYPYTAASTDLASAIFNEGWQERLNITYEDLQWVATGERLTEKTFGKYRKEGGTVINHMMQPSWIQSGIKANGVMIASDGMPYAKLAHPRTAGTFSRVLGKYVREEQIIDLTTAIEKMTLLPAKRLEGISPMMRFKGRIQIGSDADITIFDPKTIIDKATFEKGLAFSEGIEHVIVNGIMVVRDGLTVQNTFPGKPIYSKFKK